jgi:hypothetical protein
MLDDRSPIATFFSSGYEARYMAMPRANSLCTHGY